MSIPEKSLFYNFTKNDVANLEKVKINAISGGCQLKQVRSSTNLFFFICIWKKWCFKKSLPIKWKINALFHFSASRNALGFVIAAWSTVFSAFCNMILSRRIIYWSNSTNGKVFCFNFCLWFTMITTFFLVTSHLTVDEISTYIVYDWNEGCFHRPAFVVCVNTLNFFS